MTRGFDKYGYSIAIRSTSLAPYPTSRSVLGRARCWGAGECWGVLPLEKVLNLGPALASLFELTSPSWKNAPEMRNNVDIAPTV